MRLGDLDDLINVKPEFMNEKVVRDTKYRTAKDRIYAKAWNACNSYWLNTIKNAPTVAVNCKDCDGYEAGYSAGLKDAERPQGEWIRTGSLGNGNAHYECSNCHYGDEHAESQEVPYCWHCGADMRGVLNG